MTGRLGGRFLRLGARPRLPGRPARVLAGDPFAVLGLDSGADLTDDEVRAVWRRIAAATHPDRADGGDPERFAAAAAAYTDLRTRFGRGEARAALGPAGARTGRGHAGTRVGVRAARGHAGGLLAAVSDAIAGVAVRVTRGRPARLALRVIVAATAATIAVLVAGHGPAAPALVTGAATWLLLTGGHDLGSPINTSSPHSRSPHKGQVGRDHGVKDA